MAKALLVLIITLSLTSCAPAQQQPPRPAQAPPSATQAPPTPREFRAVWVASVSNINWPRTGRSVAEQKQDMIALLDKAVALNLNAVIFQVRPAADAMYKSDLEPWSQYLTGTQGQAPSPYYDPLEMWITEAHRRGLELHAWFNPYRVKAGLRGELSPKSIARTHPQVVREYGNQLWMDPGEPIAAQHTLAVIKDIVRRYDIDAVHTDDYYYPYVIKDQATSKPVDFPDEESYARYQQAGGKLGKKDWRRNNVNQLIERIYAETRKLKPWVKVGYAPFGIWKPGHPPGIEGMSQYDEIYADAKLWLNRGWLDYLSPQLYWPIGGKQDFDKLLQWWLSENTQRRHVWPGMSVSRHSIQEVLNQIALTRKHAPLDPGQVIWSARGIYPRRDGTDLGKALVEGPYTQKAVVPPSPWLDNTPPPPPIASAARDRNRAAVLTIRPGAGEPTFLYAIHIRYGDTWRFTTLPGGAPSIALNPDPAHGPATLIVVSAIDRTGNESNRLTLAVR